MNYTITRDGQQYGPYTLGDLQRYVASGEILLDDMVLSEGMSEPMPVAQIVGTIAMSVPVAPVPVNPASLYPNPQNLHWGWLVLFMCLSYGLFLPVWGLVLSLWLRKVSPKSLVLYYYIGEIAMWCIAVLLPGMAILPSRGSSYGDLFGILHFIVSLIARYSFRDAMQNHYNRQEGISLSLSGWMTFFFGEIYFQYHVNDIVRWKKAHGILAPEL